MAECGTSEEELKRPEEINFGLTFVADDDDDNEFTVYNK